MYHPDIIKFIKAKKEEGKITNANISVMVDDAFMKAVENDEFYWTEFEGVKHERIKARKVWKLLVNGAWENGEPGVLFRNRINKSPYSEVGQEIFATNPCAEQPLPPNGVCNIGSLDLSKFIKDGELDKELLELAVRLSVRFLDAVVDKSSYPTEGIAEWARENRAIAVGIMGLADYYLMKEIMYGSQESLDELEMIMKLISETAYDESELLGERHGVPKMCQRLEKPRRNITVTTIAPTGTVSIISGCSSGIEPVFSETVIRNDKTGTYEFSKDEDLAKKPYFKCANSNVGKRKEVTWEEHVNILASAQKYVDSGVSKTINCPNKITKKDISKAMFLAWTSGCKGVAIYREGSRKKQVLKVKK